MKRQLSTVTESEKVRFKVDTNDNLEDTKKQIINISSISTYDGVYDKYSEKRDVKRFKHDQINIIIEQFLQGEFKGLHTLNFDCCGGCIDCGHNQWVFQSKEITSNCMQLIKLGLQAGWTIYISDFALKVFISAYNLVPELEIGECPFRMSESSRSEGDIEIQFMLDKNFDGPFEQLRLLTEPKDNLGIAKIRIVNDTILYDLNLDIAQRNSHIYQIEIQAIEVTTGTPIICEMRFTQYPGKINTYGCHLSKLIHCNTSEERLLRCLNCVESIDFQAELELAGDNQELRMASIQKIASRTISSY
jgi:hypothetical protein